MRSRDEHRDCSLSPSFLPAVFELAGEQRSMMEGKTQQNTGSQVRRPRALEN